MVHIIICLTVVGGLISCLLVILTSKITLKPYKTKKPERDWKIRATQDTASWASRSNFDFLGFYTVHCGMRGFMAAWKSKVKPTYLCQYILRTNRETVIACDFVTPFEDEIGLTTSDTKDSIFFPKPHGSYQQSFWIGSVDELHRMHLEAEEFLITRGGARVEKYPIEFEEYFVSSLKKTSRYNLKHWYWIFFILYFYFVRKNRWHNKTIRE